MNFVCPKGFKNINGEDLQITLGPNEVRYIPVKMMIDEAADAGTSVIVTRLLSQSGALMVQKEIQHIINIDSSLTISPLVTSYYRSLADDPISVKVKVSNTGNVTQDLTVVCKFPDPSEPNIFFEQNASIKAKKDSVFTFTYLPSKALARQSNFVISITGFRNPEKELFGSANISVQNISSVQKYQNLDLYNFSEENQNQITTSYRKVGKEVDIFQITGSGGVNLSAGSLFVRGNIAILNSQQNPLVTNTNLIFRQGKSEYNVGSINKLLDMTLVGRGAEYVHTFSKNQKLEVGFVDQNFNLTEKNGWLKNGYGFFTKGTLQSNNSTRNLSAAYIYRHDPFEKVKHHTLGTEGNYDFNEFWRVNAKLNGGVSVYESQTSVKPSMAAETNYSGKIDQFYLNGNYFYSSDYYPGNRRGSLLLQQNISTQIKKQSLHANISISDFSPKFFFYDRAQLSQNKRFEIGNRFPKVKDFTFNILYQYQNEGSNSYNNLFSGWNDQDVRRMTAHRIIEQISWVNSPSRQTLIVGIETGLVKYPSSETKQFQMKLSGNYSFKKFNINTIFQSGSYYLSEYAFSTLIGTEEYRKMTFSLFYNDSFFKDKIIFSTGVSYIDDAVYGKSPSAFINSKYSGKNFSAFLNSSWYNYSSGAVNSSIMTFEVGVSLNLRKNVLNSSKKSNIKAYAFYDTNGNNIYDENEEPAADYILTINNVALQTNKFGEASYKGVPFGKYNLKQLIQQGWYYDEAEFNVDGYVHDLLIPLHQNGSLKGKVSFDYNVKTAVDFERRGSGITFSILKDDQPVQKIFTDDEGNFSSFLPTGDYTVVLSESSLPNNTFSEIKTQKIQITAGKISTVPDFIIKVKEKKINTKKFGN
ncbi:hypothetical protein K0U91_15395 [Chryseobacterium chendengshani]|uniref:COG1470 family protein n=1 Tax=Chryseobacterium sp. LJ668 TaxID=2864040 RepID=UPI001C68743F|nr:hypothetical protein [Chryseobacterium sp. LJ668]MBW8522894.1 hypothetical protein [Chryseobacterium sp. LJ668]QYK16424.1 hypothetical protein K0U91_15395 [Chryseobacterium sp. LJ668]